MPPMLILLSVERNRYRPEPERMEKGRKKHRTRIRRYRFGRISQERTEAAFPRVMPQKRKRLRVRGIVRRIARR